MTQWGMLLLCVYISLGVGRATRRKAGRIALVVTAIVIGAVIISYKHKTIVDDYAPSIDAPVYATGIQTTSATQSPTAQEDVSGVKPANFGTTNKASLTGGAGGGGGS
jgi:hypothetical protein